MVWYGISLGVVIGGGAGDDVPSGDGGAGLGAGRNINSDSDSENGGRDYFRFGGMKFGCMLEEF